MRSGGTLMHSKRHPVASAEEKSLPTKKEKTPCCGEKHGVRTYPNRTYGWAPYLSKSHFCVSTTSPHKYDPDKYGSHDTYKIFPSHGARTYPDRTYGGGPYLSKSGIFISTMHPHKYDLDKYGRHDAFQHKHGARTYPDRT